jgi:hypothetical protein
MMNASEKDGHVLTALWKQYEDASRADRPQKEAEILAKIKTEAQKQRLPVDFYDAATKYVESVQRRDWKKRAELRTQLLHRHVGVLYRVMQRRCRQQLLIRRDGGYYLYCLQRMNNIRKTLAPTFCVVMSLDGEDDRLVQQCGI